MPTYVYKFVKTGETIEVQQSFDEDALTQAVHPVSGRKMAVKKVFTPVGVTFKGGGFYKTDSRGKSTMTSTSSLGNTSIVLQFVEHVVGVHRVEDVGRVVEHDTLTRSGVTPVGSRR